MGEKLALCVQVTPLGVTQHEKWWVVIFHLCRQLWTMCPLHGCIHCGLLQCVWGAREILGILLEGSVLKPVGGMLL